MVDYQSKFRRKKGKKKYMDEETETRMVKANN